MSLPRLRQVVLDALDARALAEFYRELLDLAYRPGDEVPADGEPDPRGADGLVLRDDAGTCLASSRSAPSRRRPGRSTTCHSRSTST